MINKFMSIEDIQKGYPKEILNHISVVSRIESFLEDQNVTPNPIDITFRLNDYHNSNYFRPSGLGNKTGKSLCGKYPIGCACQLYYDYIGAPSTGLIEPRLRRIFDEGSAIHAVLQGYLSTFAALTSGDEDFNPEARINPNHNTIADMYDISGSTDGIYTIHVPLQIRFGVEFKTINDEGYKKTNGPHAEHLIQGTVYQKCLDLPFMIFVYYNKNDSSIIEYVQIYDEHRWEAIVKKIQYVQEHAILKTPPNKEDGWHCNQCKYKKICGPSNHKTNIKSARTRLFEKTGGII